MTQIYAFLFLVVGTVIIAGVINLTAEQAAERCLFMGVALLVHWALDKLGLWKEAR